MIKGIIFDLDGTLLNTISDIAKSMNAVLEDYGYREFTEDEYMLKVGNGFRKLIERSLPKDSDEDLIIEALEKFFYYYNMYYMDASKPYDGIIPLLKELNKQDIKLAINTNKREDYAANLINTRFNEVELIGFKGQVEDRPIKPDPTGANELIELMNLDKSEVIYVGDSHTDVLTGTNAGLDVVGVSWGFRGYDELKDANATYIINEPDELLELINKINTK